LLRKIIGLLLYAAVFIICYTWGVSQAAADSIETTIDTGKGPAAAAVNPVTNKVYFANRFSNDVTVIDGATNSVAATVYTGPRAMPYAIAVNPETNKIYIANFINNTISVIDGTSNSIIANINVMQGPLALAVNSSSNKIYVANNIDNCVTVIDGASDSVVATIPTGSGTGPQAIAVNPVSNKIYVANYLSSNVMAINGASNIITSTVPVGSRPRALAVNPVTNKIYVASYFGNNVTVIDGASDSFDATVTVGNSPRDGIAVNPVTNKIYVANYKSAMTVINGADNTTSTLSGGSGCNAVAVNAATNKIYVDNGSNVMVIEGADNSFNTLALGASPVVVGANPVTNKIYVANGVNVTVLDGAPDGPAENIPLTVSIASLPGNVTYSATPSFSFTAQSSYSPNSPAIQNIYYQLDNCAGQWQRADNFVQAGNSASASGTPPQALTPGLHILYAFAVDGQAATSINTGYNGSPVIGRIASYTFTFDPPAVTNITPGSGPESGGTLVMISGVGFTGATSVKFGSSNAASFTVVNDTRIDAVAPAGSDTVHVTVTGPGGDSATTLNDQYTYAQTPPWDFIFEDYKQPAIKLYVNTQSKTFQFVTPDKTFPVKNAAYLTYIENSGRPVLAISYYDGDMYLTAEAVCGNTDLCSVTAMDYKTKKVYVLLDKLGLE